MKVYIVRHGESETNVKGIWTGWLDVNLTEQGKEDAKLAKEVLSGVKFDKVYSSDLKRAMQTASICAPDYEVETSALIREINVGTLAGKESNSLSEEDKKVYSEFGYKSVGGESRDEFNERVLNFKSMLEGQNYQNVAVFAHAGVLRRFLYSVLETTIPIKNFCCKNCAVMVFEYDNLKWKLHSLINVK